MKPQRVTLCLQRADFCSFLLGPFAKHTVSSCHFPNCKMEKTLLLCYRAIRISAPKVCKAFRFCDNNAHADEVHHVFSSISKPSSAVPVPGYFTPRFTVPPLQLILKINSKLNLQSDSG